jgi:hypothetical protein
LLAGLLPLVAYQVISIAHGWPWLPSSVLVRGGMVGTATMADPGSTVAHSPIIARALGVLSLFVQNAGAGMHLVALIVFTGILLSITVSRSSSIWSMQNIGAAAFIVGAVAHLLFGHVGHFFRYEAYLMASGLFVSACLIPDGMSFFKRGLTGVWRRTILMMLFVVSFVWLVFTLSIHAWDSMLLTPVATRNIYEQQYQMGTFLRQYYPTSSIAVNDIGAVSFLTDVHLVDLVGLASLDILQLKRSGTYDTEHVGSICAEHKVRMALAYDSWLQRISERTGPLSWTKVGEWRIVDNVVCSDDVVSIYATEKSEIGELLRHLKEYASVLPPRVQQTLAPSVQLDR